MPKDDRYEKIHMAFYGMNHSIDRLQAVFDSLKTDGKLAPEMEGVFEAFKVAHDWLKRLAYDAMMAEADTHTTQEMQAAKDSKG